jgi:catechol 2,3-dioxygenase
MRRSIHPGTTVGPVWLTISSLDRALAFYEHSLGFRVHQRESNTVRLGAGAADLLVLTENAKAWPARGTTGLFHLAVLVPSRLALAQVLRHLAESRVPLHGASDHLVSEALYLADPEGNGIEIYRDRPRAEWRYDGAEVRMVTDPLDLDGLLLELEGRDPPWTGLPKGTVIGHVHLRVAEISAAEHFYRDVLGFDLTTRYGASASFLSAGGYHHHVAANTWTSLGAPPPSPGSLGLRAFAVRLPDAQALEPVLARVREAGVTPEETPLGLLLRDPSGNGVLLQSGGG